MRDELDFPAPVVERITWHASRVRLPEDTRTVLVYVPCGTLVDDPVDDTLETFPGWYDPETEQWFTADAFPVDMVTWWAEMPHGPSEAKVNRPGALR